MCGSVRHTKESAQAKTGKPYTLSQTAKTSKNNVMAEDMKQVADLITANIINCKKEVLTSDEAAKYMGISKSYLYKLTMRGEIPHYKPMGKMCYFNRAELEEWLQRNRVSNNIEISQQAAAYCMKGGKR